MIYHCNLVLSPDRFTMASPALPAFTVDLPLHLIQAIRLTHALIETKLDVRVPAEHLAKFDALAAAFGLRLQPCDTATPVLRGIELQHPPPLSIVGNLSRPLLFPHQIFEHCRQGWPQSRPIRVSYAGLVTPARRALIGRWCRLQKLTRISIPDPESWPAIVRRRLLRRLGFATAAEMSRASAHGVTFWSSTRGRTFPIKAWDTDYFRLLHRSRFVLCPSGDFTWTYRFFEAAMCGAIPIVEESSHHYDGFYFYHLEDALDELKWSLDDAMHNFQLCHERLTIPLAELTSEVERLLVSPS